VRGLSEGGDATSASRDAAAPIRGALATVARFAAGAEHDDDAPAWSGDVRVASSDTPSASGGGA